MEKLTDEQLIKSANEQLLRILEENGRLIAANADLSTKLTNQNKAIEDHLKQSFSNAEAYRSLESEYLKTYNDNQDNFRRLHDVSIKNTQLESDIKAFSERLVLQKAETEGLRALFKDESAKNVELLGKLSDMTPKKAVREDKGIFIRLKQRSWFGTRADMYPGTVGFSIEDFAQDYDRVIDKLANLNSRLSELEDKAKKKGFFKRIFG